MGRKVELLGRHFAFKLRKCRHAHETLSVAVGEFGSQTPAQLGKVYLPSHIEANEVGLCHSTADKMFYMFSHVKHKTCKIFMLLLFDMLLLVMLLV